MLILGFAAEARGATSVGGAFNDNVTWDPSMNPINMTASITVVASATLTILPGCVIDVNNARTLTVYGKILADGTPENPIVFRPTIDFQGWGTVTLNNTGLGSVIDSCRMIEFGGINITSDQPAHMPTVSNCFLVTAGTGITVNNSNATVLSNVIKANRGISVVVNNNYRLVPVIAGGSISRYPDSVGEYGIHYQIDQNDISTTISQCHIRNFDAGVRLYSYCRYINYNNASLNLVDCNLFDNNQSLSIAPYEYGGTFFYKASMQDSWMKSVMFHTTSPPDAPVTAGDNHWTSTGLTVRTDQPTYVDFGADLPGNPYEQGDVDADGDTDLDDVTMVMDFLVGNVGALPNASDADADGDGDVDMRDATLIRAYSEALIRVLPRQTAP